MPSISKLRALASSARNLATGKPLLAIFEVNLRCNSACGYCALPLNRGRYEMTRAEIRAVFARLSRGGLRIVFVQGGEPTLRPDLADVLEDMCALGLFPVLITNGTRLSAALVARLTRLRMQISVSLDTLDRSRYRKIRGADQLPRVLEGIAALQTFAGTKFITCIVSDVNRGDVRGVVAFARERGFIPVVGAYHWGVGTYGKEDERLRYDPALAAAVFREVRDSGEVPAGYYRDYLDDSVRWLSGAASRPATPDATASPSTPPATSHRVWRIPRRAICARRRSTRYWRVLTATRSAAARARRPAICCVRGSSEPRCAGRSPARARC